jgi:hypothetical protein
MCPGKETPVPVLAAYWRLGSAQDLHDELDARAHARRIVIQWTGAAGEAAVYTAKVLPGFSTGGEIVLMIRLALAGEGLQLHRGNPRTRS